MGRIYVKKILLTGRVHFGRGGFHENIVIPDAASLIL